MTGTARSAHTRDVPTTSTASKLAPIERKTFYTSPATGVTYWIDAKGLATPALSQDEEEPEYLGCECEIDWNCGRHGTSRATWLETRYDR